MNFNHQRRLVLGFAPSGEVIAIEFPEAFVIQVTICFNLQTRDFGFATHYKIHFTLLIMCFNFILLQ